MTISRPWLFTIIAVALATIAVVLVIAFTGGSDASTHMMPNGSSMHGTMSHTMSDGSEMPGMDMSR